jgi:hypothetical protein
MNCRFFVITDCNIYFLLGPASREGKSYYLVVSTSVNLLLHPMLIICRPFSDFLLNPFLLGLSESSAILSFQAGKTKSVGWMV